MAAGANNTAAAKAVRRMYLTPMTANLSLSARRVLTLEVSGVLGVTSSDVMSVFWICAKRAAAAGERLAGGHNGIGRFAFLDPVDDSAEHVEMVESGSATAVGHAGDEEHAAPFGDLVCTAVGCGQ
jgi:hypothetical protein